MKVAPLPADEALRLAALHSSGLLDTPPEAVFDDFTRLAARLCDTPIALISLVDEHRQWFKARHGLDAPETPRDVAFCAHALHEHDRLVVPDASRDERFADNPLVTGAPHVQFYAGVPLRTSEGHALGTLCVIDHQARELDATTLDLLGVLARQVSAQIELRRLAGDLAQANDALDRLREQQDEFVSLISHDLRSPLNSVVGFAELLASEDVDDEDRRAFLARIGEGAQQTLRLASNLVDAGRITAGEPAPERTPTRIGELVTTTGKRLEGAALLAEVQLELDVAPDLPEIRVDAEMVDRALSNLISNAICYSPVGEAVRVEARADGERVVLRVRDRGPGVPPEQRERLFTRYGQLPGGAPGGAGLGLYIVRRLVEAHGGRVEYEAPDDGGSVFSMELPRA